jgi:hypothetical protein
MQFDDAHFAAVKQEIARHREDTEISKLGHWRAADVYERRHKRWFGIPATVLSLLLAGMLTSEVKALFAEQTGLQSLLVVVPVVFSLVVSLLTGLGAFLNLSELASKHRATAENLNALWRDCKNWDTDFPDQTCCEKAVQTAQSYRKRLNEINRDSPQIPKWAYRGAQRMRAQGSTTYGAQPPLQEEGRHL